MTENLSFDRPGEIGGHLDDGTLERVAQICELAAKGDLEARITNIKSEGHFGALCGSINRMLDIADSFVREAAAAMSECSQDRFHRPILLRGLKGAYRQSATIINRAGLKMRESKRQLEDASDLAVKTASNVHEIAAACEELEASNAEVSRQAADSAQLTSEAVTQVSQAGASVQTLQETMRKIDSILLLINKIAGQTNLLALNASIEAARAGEQGRGFAVVANEVKELSRNSAKAANQIGQQLEAMRIKTGEAASCIVNVNTSIQKINSGALGVANAVEQQVLATSEISRNITAASRNMERITAGMKKGSTEQARPVGVQA